LVLAVRVAQQQTQTEQSEQTLCFQLSHQVVVDEGVVETQQAGTEALAAVLDWMRLRRVAQEPLTKDMQGVMRAATLAVVEAAHHKLVLMQ
jgi:hypothetical protein